MSAVPEIALFLCVGLVAGLLHFGSLRMACDLIVHGRALAAILLTLSRFAALAFVLAFAARHGAGPLGAALAGLLVGRETILRAAKASAP